MLGLRAASSPTARCRGSFSACWLLPDLHIRAFCRALSASGSLGHRTQTVPASGAHSHASEITVARRTVRGQSFVHAHYSEPESEQHVAVASPRPTVLAASWHGVPWTPSASDMPLVLLVCLPCREKPGHAMYTVGNWVWIRVRRRGEVHCVCSCFYIRSVSASREGRRLDRWRDSVVNGYNPRREAQNGPSSAAQARP